MFLAPILYFFLLSPPPPPPSIPPHLKYTPTHPRPHPQLPNPISLRVVAPPIPLLVWGQCCTNLLTGHMSIGTPTCSSLNEGEAGKAKSASLHRDLLDLYVRAQQLQTYRQVNLTAFRKIIKKADKQVCVSSSLSQNSAAPFTLRHTQTLMCARSLSNFGVLPLCARTAAAIVSAGESHSVQENHEEGR